MGKGDQKSRKGKISMGSYGNTRPQKSAKSTAGKPVATPAATSENEGEA
ncbi:30S ribosomal protein THX [Spirosoma sp. BT702]|uniref:30S ribosomal protein THX n=1 Tax=Spirosoma profusum TaxID=2771354 RepID=A0A926XWB9_9BACT|nr:30S ribosomal protein THX [Spirosoma profusum]MBD2701933.1 30S ribosomal protein THX [Spirosoma profusum]